MYVDDLITGFDNENQAISVCKQISTILKSASFVLRKWAFNSSTILDCLHNSAEQFSTLELGVHDKVLQQ